MASVCLSSDEEDKPPVTVSAKTSAEKAPTKRPPDGSSGPTTTAQKRKHAEQDLSLPYGWIRKESKSKKGAWYYANIVTGKTQVERPGSRPASQSAKVQPPRVEREEVAKKKAEEEEVRRKKAEEEEKELEEVKRQAAERRAAREKAIADAAAAAAAEEDSAILAAEADGAKASPDQDQKNSSDSSDSDSSAEMTKEELQKWKEAEEKREKKEAERLAKRQRMEQGIEEPLPSDIPKVEELCLDIIKDDAWVERHSLTGEKQRWVLGRAKDQVDFQLNHTSISRQHAAISRGGAGMFIMDLNSAHGVTVGGKKIPKMARVQLKPGTRIQFGASTRTYVYQEPKAEES
eukprot:TRINITY_DN10487_c0_g2_i2.p1 TRINITY_DN10487_c0_g2~~TRINITY_DN10487_c0_g2_i2.p1  ORF type:complete len:347 (+),score=108.96 TRINITY_DN10487_c0_g2_i2:42-1082(+)